MKWSFATIGVILLGIIGVAIILLFQQLTTGSENDYYLLKEVTEAAMIDSIDVSYYRETGNLKIVKEKFIENFTRRYAESTLFLGTKYSISFFDIMEGGETDGPPKATVLIDTGTENYHIYNTTGDYNVKNNLTGIFEFIGKKTGEHVEMGRDIYESSSFYKTYYLMPTINSDNSFERKEPLNFPEELLGREVKDINVTLESGGAVNTVEEVQTAKLKREIDWARAADGTYPGTSYYSKIETGNLATSCTVNNFKYYNCKTRTGTFFDGIDCSKYNTIWINYSGSCNKDNAVIKINTKWTYKEYKYE